MQRHFVSYPKSGRTWIRYMLTQLGVDDHIVFQHDGFEFNNGACPPHNFDIERRLARYAPPDKLVYLERDPRDVMVSLYFQVTGRFKDFFGYQGSISDFVRDDYFGAMNLHRFRAMWADLCARRGFLAVSYEACHDDAEGVIRRLLDYFELQAESADIAQAVAGASFEKMRQVEQSGAFPQPWLRPRNDAPKVRRGRVGGFQDTLNTEDITYLNSVFSMPDMSSAIRERDLSAIS